MSTYQLKLPISRGTYYGLTHIETPEESVKQDFRMLLLTAPGEKIDSPDYGCGLITYLFQNDTPTLREEIETNIRIKTEKYLPLINITNILFMYDEKSVLNLLITFYIGSIDNLNEVSFKFNSIEQ